MRSRVIAAAGVLTLSLALLAGCATGHSGAAGSGQRSPGVRTAAGRHQPVPVLVAKASPGVVYVLASAGHGAAELFRSTDRGLGFSQVTAPVFLRLQVRIMTFANPSDGVAVLGAAGRPDRVLVTDDGAQHWHQASLGGSGAITAVAGHGGQIYALELNCHSSDYCQDPRLYRAAAGSPDWTRAAAAGTAGVRGAGGIGLAAWGPHVWLTIGNGVAPTIGLLSSADSGASFARVASLEAVACGPLAGSATSVWLWCSGGMLLTFDRFSAVTGKLQPLRPTGAGTANTFLYPLSGRLVLFGTAAGSKGGGLYLSRDGGRRFARVGYLPGPAGGLLTQVTFLTAKDGLALVSHRTLLRTDDGGLSWTAVRL